MKRYFEVNPPNPATTPDLTNATQDPDLAEREN
jgi:hypothetical protein